MLGIVFIVKEPPRGALEGGSHLHNTSWFADLRHLTTKYVVFLSSLPLALPH